MLDIKSNINKYLNASGPPLDGIILMTNSDITDVIFDQISNGKASNLLSQYSMNLKYIIRAAQYKSVPIAICSPVVVLLEGPWGAPDSIRFHDKVGATEQYTEAAIQMTRRMGVPYINIRAPTLAAIPIYRMYYLG